ncbi:MAG: hypothetical protein NZ602_07940 [Thermoguttaceae bacterium]|nr:hypothetical protein [Thermoguttaceae bacterium]MDW8037989.1 hypothetical protein [Thermoguttaceae bacterium]
MALLTFQPSDETSRYPPRTTGRYCLLEAMPAVEANGLIDRGIRPLAVPLWPAVSEEEPPHPPEVVWNPFQAISVV